MNEPATDDRIDEPRAGTALMGKRVVTADGVDLGTIEGETDTHLRVRTEQTDLPEGLIWIPKTMIAETVGDSMTLDRIRSDLHDAVLALSPGEQREFASLGFNVRIGRARGLAHPVS
jgi:hypothetical protein